MNSEVRFIVKTILKKREWYTKVNDINITSKWKKEFTDEGLHFENFNQAVLFLKEYSLAITTPKLYEINSIDGVRSL